MKVYSRRLFLVFSRRGISRLKARFAWVCRVPDLLDGSCRSIHVDERRFSPRLLFGTLRTFRLFVRSHADLILRVSSCAFQLRLIVLLLLPCIFSGIAFYAVMHPKTTTSKCRDNRKHPETQSPQKPGGLGLKPGSPPPPPIPCPPPAPPICSEPGNLAPPRAVLRTSNLAHF